MNKKDFVRSLGRPVLTCIMIGALTTSFMAAVASFYLGDLMEGIQFLLTGILGLILVRHEGGV